MGADVVRCRVGTSTLWYGLERAAGYPTVGLTATRTELTFKAFPFGVTRVLRAEVTCVYLERRWFGEIGRLEAPGSSLSRSFTFWCPGLLQLLDDLAALDWPCDLVVRQARWP